MFRQKIEETRTSIKKQDVTCRSSRVLALPNHAKTRKKAKMRPATCRRHHFCKGVPLYRRSSKTRKTPEKTEHTCLRLLMKGKIQRMTTRNRQIFLHFTCIQPQKHTISCRPKGRSAPLAWCLPRAAGRRGAVIGHCHADVALGSALDSTGALWYPRPKGANTHRSLSGGSDRRLRGRISPRRFRRCVWIKGVNRQCEARQIQSWWEIRGHKNNRRGSE